MVEWCEARGGHLTRKRRGWQAVKCLCDFLVSIEYCVTHPLEGQACPYAKATPVLPRDVQPLSQDVLRKLLALPKTDDPAMRRTHAIFYLLVVSNVPIELIVRVLLSQLDLEGERLVFGAPGMTPPAAECLVTDDLRLVLARFVTEARPRLAAPAAQRLFAAGMSAPTRQAFWKQLAAYATFCGISSPVTAPMVMRTLAEGVEFPLQDAQS